MMPFPGDVRSLVLCSVVWTSCVLQVGCLQEAPAPSIERGVAVLIVLLQDDNPDIRRTAAESLGKIGDRSAIPMTLPLLTDPLPAIRAAAAKALGRMAAPADDDVIAGLVHALQDSSDLVKQAAALAIGDIEPPAIRLASVADLLRSSDAQVRRAAVRALLLLDTGQIAGWLLPVLDDSDADIRQAAVAALGASGDPRVATALATRLAQDPSAGVRAEAAYHLGESSGQQLRTVLQTAMQKEADRGVRRWIEAELRALRAND
jgi:HEAT repeat protein